MTRRRLVRPDDNKCFIFFYHDVLDLISDGEQIMLDLIDMVTGIKLEEENNASKESTRSALIALLALKSTRATNLNMMLVFQLRMVLPGQRGQNLSGFLPVQTFNLLLLNGTIPIGHPQHTKTGTRFLLLIA